MKNVLHRLRMRLRICKVVWRVLWKSLCLIQVFCLFISGTRECEQCKPHITTKCDALFNVSTPSLQANNTTATLTLVNNTTSTTNATTVNVNVTSPGTVLDTSTFYKPNATVPSTAPITSNQTITSNASTNSPFIVEWKPKPKVQEKPTNVTTTTALDSSEYVIEPVSDTVNDTLHQNYTI